MTLTPEQFSRLSPEEQDEIALIDLQLEELERIEGIRKSLHAFIENFWSVVEPAVPFVDNWHIGAICEHLEAITSGQIRELAIAVPPGAMKSLTCAVFYPAWEWCQNPALKYLYGSYSQSFALRDSKRMRSLLESPQFKFFNSGAFGIANNTDRQDLFANDKGGYRLSVGIGGGGGWRIDRAVADDPTNPLDAESPAELEAARLWWLETIPGRAQDLRTMAKLIVMQRLHRKDLIGTCIARDLGYEVLCLPMRYEPEFVAKPTKLGFVDKRTEPGELLNKIRMPEIEVAKLEKQLGFHGTAAQLQQRPVPRSGDNPLFSRQKFEVNIRKEPPNGLTLIRYWDKAFTAGGGAFTVGVLMGRSKEDDYWVLDVKRGQWGADYRDAQILLTAQQDKDVHTKVQTWLEQEPGSQGRDSCAILIKKLAGHSVQADPVKEDKTVRAISFSSQQLAGNVYLIEATWNEDYISELCTFPESDYKDQTDASSGAFNKLALYKSRNWASYNPVIDTKKVQTAQ